jgi:hypothetical protein
VESWGLSAGARFTTLHSHEYWSPVPVRDPLSFSAGNSGVGLRRWDLAEEQGHSIVLTWCALTELDSGRQTRCFHRQTQPEPARRHHYPLVLRREPPYPLINRNTRGFWRSLARSTLFAAVLERFSLQAAGLRFYFLFGPRSSRCVRSLLLILLSALCSLRGCHSFVFRRCLRSRCHSAHCRFTALCLTNNISIHHFYAGAANGA